MGSVGENRSLVLYAELGAEALMKYFHFGPWQHYLGISTIGHSPPAFTLALLLSGRVMLTVRLSTKSFAE